MNADTETEAVEQGHNREHTKTLHGKAGRRGNLHTERVHIEICEEYTLACSGSAAAEKYGRRFVGRGKCFGQRFVFTCRDKVVPTNDIFAVGQLLRLFLQCERIQNVKGKL